MPFGCRFREESNAIMFSMYARVFLLVQHGIREKPTPPISSHDRAFVSRPEWTPRRQQETAPLSSANRAQDPLREGTVFAGLAAASLSF